MNKSELKRKYRRTMGDIPYLYHVYVFYYDKVECNKCQKNVQGTTKHCHTLLFKS